MIYVKAQDSGQLKPLPDREEAPSEECRTALTHPCSWGSPRARRSPGSPSPPERTPYTCRISTGVRASRVRLEEDNLILKYKMRHYGHYMHTIHITPACQPHSAPPTRPPAHPAHTPRHRLKKTSLYPPHLAGLLRLPSFGVLKRCGGKRGEEGGAGEEDYNRHAHATIWGSSRSDVRRNTGRPGGLRF